MRIGCFSDTHLEGDELIPLVDALLPVAGSVDVFVALGDLADGDKLPDLARRVVERLGVPCLVLPGNHEYWYTYYASTVKRDLEAYWRDEFSKIPGAHILLDDSVDIDGVSFFGSTWWTNFALHGSDRVGDSMALSGMNYDFKLIMTEYLPKEHAVEEALRGRAAKGMSCLSPQGMRDLNLQAVCRYKQWHKDSEGKKRVLLTHFPPLKDLGHPNFPPSAYFASADDLLLQQYKPDTLMYGHTHHNYGGILLHGIPVHSNMFGYPREEGRIGYDPNLVIEI